MIQTGIIGATGYTGGELIRLLSAHPEVNLARIGSRSLAGKPVSTVHDHLWHMTDTLFCDSDYKNFLACDVVFLALPHGESSRNAKELAEQGVKVIDLGADFRLNDYALYTEWYESPHVWPEALPNTVYGLPEVHKERIADATVVANPGCFPTSIILGLAPLLDKKWVHTDFIVADSDSGVTGAGKGLSDNTHFPAIHDNLTAYKIGAHRHLPEIRQELEGLANEAVDIVFNPHLVPVNRGILTTLTAKTTSPLNQETVNAHYRSYYADAPFVRVRDAAHLPQVKNVRGSNFCDVAPIVINDHTIVVISAIDNLVKGASGQAVQNMNIMFQLNETMGLTQLPLCP